MSNKLDGITLHAEGEANCYRLMRGGNWLAAIRMNGELLVWDQEAILRAMLQGEQQAAQPIRVGDLTPQQRLELARGTEAAPVAYITGQFAGRCIIEPINRAAVLPTGMALYSHQQPSAGVVMPERKECDDGYPSDDWLMASAWNACLDEFARLNGKEVGQ